MIYKPPPAPEDTRALGGYMKLIPVHIDGNFSGYKTMKEIKELQAEAYQIARKTQHELQADHMIYCHYDYNDDNTMRTAWFYSGLAMDDKEFDQRTNIKNAYIGAIHKL